MTTDKPAGEMPDEVTVSRIRWEDGYILTLMDYGDCPDPVRQTARYVRADKPDAAAAREILSKLEKCIEFSPEYPASYWLYEDAGLVIEEHWDIIKRILQREAGG